MQALDPKTVSLLKDAAGPDGATENESEIAPHLKEWRGRWHGTAALMLRPSSTAAVSNIMRICHANNTAIVPQGGNTGLVGGQIPTRGEVLLSLTRMNRVRSLSTTDYTLVAEAGAILSDVRMAADAVGLLFPLSLAAEGSCTIGGNISTNAGGVGVLRYGMSRDLVLGLEVVLADGSVLDLMRGLRKDNTGYDLKQLFVGAEGTLGIVTASMLKLFPKPGSYTTLVAGLSAIETAVPLLNRLQDATGGLVTAFEIMSRPALDLVLRHIAGTLAPLPAHAGWSVLIETLNPPSFDATPALEEALSRTIEDGLVSDAVFAKNERDRASLWRLREAIPEAQRIDGASLSNDVSVTPSHIAAFVDAADTAVRAVFSHARPIVFGHIGDGNLHFAVRAASGKDDELLAARDRIESAINEEIEKFGGSISAEHGLGLAKNNTAALYKSAAEIAVMRALKRALDPKNILNPGKLLPD